MDSGFLHTIFLIVFVVLCLDGPTEGHSKTYDVLTAEVKELRTLVVDLKQQIAKNEVRIKELSETEVNGQDVTNNGEKGRSFRTKRAVRRRRSNPEVGFLVSLSRQQLQVEKDGVLKFDRVITNLGNAYNSQTGTFKCQIPGTYMFDLNLISEIGSYVEASITLNGVSKVTAISDHRDVYAGRDQGSAAAILVLRKGDTISVKIDWPVDPQTVHGEGKTTFSGYLLRRHRVNRILS